MDYKKRSINRICTASTLLFLLGGCIASYAQTDTQKQKIKETYKASKLHDLTGRLKEKNKWERKHLLEIAAAKGWKIYDTLPNGSYSELQEIGADGTPLYYTTFSDYATTVSRANTLYKNGLLQLGVDGMGMHVGTWDGGTALATHQEFGAKVILGDATGTPNSHATMVMGTLVAKGVKAKAKGVAFNATATSYDWTRDKIEVAEAASTGLLISNHSYGIQSDRVPDWYFGAYIKATQEWDQIMYNAPYYLMVTAAGNSQKLNHNASPVHGTTPEGFDLLLGFALTKNGITVAAADTKIDTNGQLTQANVTGYSSFGPVDDSRVKPDIAGAGGSIYAASAQGNSSYESSFGTSMATPGITGTLLLLQQYYEQIHGNYMLASTLKGLALHSADDVKEPGPDYKMGWGVMNAMTAAELIKAKDFKSIITETELANGETYEITVKANDNQVMEASISWTDPAADQVNKGILNDNTPALVNDLDIRVSQDGTTFFPWKLSALNANQPATKGDNQVDPFEKIRIDNAQGAYIIRVSHKKNLKNNRQKFTLIVSGIAVTDCALNTPEAISIDTAGEDAVSLFWNPIKDAIFEVQYTPSGAESWTSLYTSENKIRLEELLTGQEYAVRVRTWCTENNTSEYSNPFQFLFLGSETPLGDQPNYQTLSVNEALGISIFPNPATEYLVVSGMRSAFAQYRILTTAGVVLQQGDVHPSGIDVNQLASGLYLLVVQDMEGLRSTKFYKG